MNQANSKDQKQAIKSRDTTIKAVHDNNSAVNYAVFDKNQWVSYDDERTFKQKLHWANDIGLGGSLIWASDTDNDKYSAMSGFIGKKVFHPNLTRRAFQNTQAAIAQSLIGENGQDCRMMKDCVDTDIVRCPDGHKKMGWDKAGCKVIITLNGFCICSEGINMK